MSKDTRKTIRFSDEVMQYIEAQPGEHFTDKLESLILRHKLELTVREKEIQRLEKKITDANRTLNELKEIQLEIYALSERVKNFADKLLSD